MSGSSAARNAIGGMLLAVGMIAMIAIWLYTSYAFFATDRTGLGLIALLIPPADIVLPFLLSPILGVAGLVSMGVAFAGSAMRTDD